MYVIYCTACFTKKIGFHWNKIIQTLLNLASATTIIARCVLVSKVVSDSLFYWTTLGTKGSCKFNSFSRVPAWDSACSFKETDQS